MKKQIYHEIAPGEHTLKRAIIDPILSCPVCGTKPTFCRSILSYGYCMKAVLGVDKCTFHPDIKISAAYVFAVTEWNTAVLSWKYNAKHGNKQNA